MLELSDHIEFISILIRSLPQKGKGFPAREPVVSEKEQKEMMAYYYRRQEQMKVGHSLDTRDLVACLHAINVHVEDYYIVIDDHFWLYEI